MTNKRTYKDEPYLRSEHLLKDGKYQSVIVEIQDVIYDCPGKSGDKDKLMKGLAFKGAEKVLGMNKTNEGLVAVQCGDSRPEKWIGQKVQLVVRLVRNKKLMEPGIRIWPNKPIPRAQLRDNMGEEIPDNWPGYGTTKEEGSKEQA